MPMDDEAKIRRLEAFKFTLKNERVDSISPLERIQLTNQVIEWNLWIADAKYWAQNPWTNIFYNKKVLTLEPIK